MIRRFGAVLSVSLVVGCFDGGSGEDEIAESGTSESESESTSESTSTSSTTESTATEESTTEESTTESTSTESTTGDPEPVCGNGIIEGDEACDDGPMPVLMPGACAPDCSTVIEVKRIKLGSPLLNGDFGNNPVAFADSTCEPGYKAMFAYGNLRVATTMPWETVGPVDWPIQRYTAYVNGSDKLIWVTDETRMIAVRDGQKVAPVNPFLQCMICPVESIVSGMADDWTTALSDNCNGWTNADGTASFSVGEYDEFDLNIQLRACAADFPGVHRIFCIEQ